ncbi:hypothetical protein C5167_048523, partial [Papaver somniferum]
YIRNPHTNLPGPVHVPIIGNLLKLGKKPQESLTVLAERYGPLMSLKLGTLTTIVVPSSAMAKEILQNNDQSFSGRYVLDGMTYGRTFVLNGVTLENSHIFTTQKLDSNQNLRHQKFNDLVTYVGRNASSGSAIDIGQASFTTVLNLISNSFFSMDLADLSSDTVSTFKRAVRGVLLEAGKPNLSDFFPLLRFIDVQVIRRRTKKHVRILDETFDKIIDKKMTLLQSREKNSASSGDLLDIILDSSHENGIQLQRHEIKALLRDFFAAGTDTSSSTIEWAMAELLHDPCKMIKVQQEISSIIGRDRPIEEPDIVRLPYLQAIVKETLGLHPPVLVNVWAIGRDPTIWAHPTCFKPERFLGSKLDYKGQDLELIPFGSGRRICPGLPLAHRMVHLVLGLLLQSFDWKLENALKPEDLDMKEESGFTSVKTTGLRAIPTASL